LIHQVFQICTSKAGSGLGNHRKVYVKAQGLVAGVNLQDLLTALYVGVADHDLTVKPARTQQGRVQDIPAVGGGDDDDAFVVAETVHLHQQLVQGLLPFIVSTAQTSTTVTAHGVDLIDEDNGRRILLGLFKQVPYTGS